MLGTKKLKVCVVVRPSLPTHTIDERNYGKQEDYFITDSRK